MEGVWKLDRHNLSLLMVLIIYQPRNRDIDLSSRNRYVMFWWQRPYIYIYICIVYIIVCY